MGFLFGIILVTVFIFFLWLFTVSPILCIILLVAFAIWGINTKSKDKEKKQQKVESNLSFLNDARNSLDDFKQSQSYAEKDYNAKIMLDEKNKKVGFIYSANEIKKIYPYSKILECQVIEDDQTVSQTSRGSQIGGALVGGALAGGVGAMIGGLSGKSISNTEVFKIDLKVIVDDASNPINIIKFLSPKIDSTNFKPIPYKKSDKLYIQAKHDVDHWHSLLSVLINNENKKSESVSSSSVADELLKLMELKNQGILTEDEFNEQKVRVINNQ